MKKLSAKSADALDLAIEFATLGEYGLEYPDQGLACRRPDCHHGRSDSTVFPSTGRRRRDPHREARASLATPARKGGTDSSPRRPSAVCSSETTDFASALRPPRINLSFSD